MGYLKEEQEVEECEGSLGGNMESMEIWKV